MSGLAVILCVTIPLALLAREVQRQPLKRVTLSHFWYFTLIWMAAFPLRAWLIDSGWQVSQVIMTGAATKPDSTFLAAALAVAFTYWLAVYGGYRWADDGSCDTLSATDYPEEIDRARLFAVGVGWLVVSLGATLYLAPAPSDLDGSPYLSARTGAGLIWMLPEQFVPAFIAFLGCITVRPDLVGRRLLIFVLVLATAVSLWLTMQFSTRRLLAAVLLGMVVVTVLRKGRLWPLGVAAIVGSVFGAGVFELVRYIPAAIHNAAERDESAAMAVATIINTALTENLLLLLSTSYEGAEHVARLLGKAGWRELLTGIDYGMSWVFNLGLSFVPRAVWQSKPVVYGGLEQMAWLYPAYVRDGLPTTAIPTSFVVDFAFGFGLPLGLVLAFFLGRYFRVCEGVLWNRAAHPVAVGFSLVTFIFMFNTVRGGTATGQTLVVFAVITASMYGIGPTVATVRQLVADTFRLRPRKGGAAPPRVFFYPHAYLRDRQLDTIRAWPAGGVANPDLVDRRHGAQVSRDAALTTRRRSWKQALPLLNVKWRPMAAPRDAAVYVWGGLILSGPYIVDLDNPYALTGYNVFAMRLYRPLIRWFLQSSRCLSIRCLSRACLDGVRDLYGEAVAAKAVVAYPFMPPKVQTPPPASADRCRFLFVATQFEIKGGAALLSAFRRVVAAFPGATLDLVTHLPPEFGEAARTCPGLTVHDAGFSREQIAERFLAHVDVLVHPTYFDSFGMVVLEAMAYGLPIIATRLYALPEMVEDGVSGILIDPPVSIWEGTRPGPMFSDTGKVRAALRTTDTRLFETALANAMLALARDPVRRSSAGQASLDRVRAWFRS
ncbi:MAG: glycosyltransferase family 4 protein [Rhodospirillales bacterium]|nr:glycosyltransferase family 4 protein [Rhodospirillales bacterium]